MVPSTSVAGGTELLSKPFSPMVWVSALATGGVLAPVTLMVTIWLSLLTPRLSVAK